MLVLGRILGALSHALDMTEGQPEGHCVRCCWIGMQIAEELGFDPHEKQDLYYTLLLKDLGCSSNAARICQLYLTDDRAFKRGFKTVDGSIKESLRFLLGHTGTSQKLSTKLRTVASVLKDSDEIITDIIESRCDQGAGIAQMMRFSSDVADGIACLDEHWNGRGRPKRLRGEDIHVFARIALLCQVVEVFWRENGAQAALQEVTSRSGSWFDPMVVAAFTTCTQKPSFWDDLGSDGLQEQVFSLPASQVSLDVTEDYLDDIALGFARVIDAKSPFTSGHSERVAKYTGFICDKLSYPQLHRRAMVRSALLHDIGKLGISNTILDKPDKLSDAEFLEMKKHPTHGFKVLNQIPEFEISAKMAATHHEKLNGTGYPFGLSAGDLDQDTRILTIADIFDALSAERPYRAALPIEKCFQIMDKMAGAEIDTDIYVAFKEEAVNFELSPA